jgi:hypothetical protein
MTLRSIAERVLVHISWLQVMPLEHIDRSKDTILPAGGQFCHPLFSVTHIAISFVVVI